MVLTAATTTTTSASAIVPAPMTRYDRALPVNAMTEKRYSDRRLRPWPPTYNYGIPGGGGGGGGAAPGGGPGTGAAMTMTGGKSRWMSAGLSDIGANLRGVASSAGSIYGGSVGGGQPHRYLYAPVPGALKRQNSDFFLNIKSASALAGAAAGYDYNNNAGGNVGTNAAIGNGNYVVNNIAARKVKNIAGMTAIVDSDSNMEVVRRMSYKYRTKNVLTATTTSGAGVASSPHGHLKAAAHHHPQHQQQQLNNSSVNSNNLSMGGGGGSNSRVVSPNQSTSSAPQQHNGGGKRVVAPLRHYNNNFGNNLNGGHTYDSQQQHLHLTHGKKLLSLKNHRSVDNLLDNVDINYSQYYQNPQKEPIALLFWALFGGGRFRRGSSKQNRKKFD
uniref:Uncharacterized protein n=1 Tax=Anopheles dirus TaxID=7168 RepID=A0A182NLR0_9DIPT